MLTVEMVSLYALPNSNVLHHSLECRTIRDAGRAIEVPLFLKPEEIPFRIGGPSKRDWRSCTVCHPVEVNDA